MGSPAVNHFIFLEPTFGRVLRIWRAWFWRFALLGGIPVALAYLVNYYNPHLSKFSALVALAVLVSQAVVIVPFWAYTYTFRVLFEKSLGGIRIRLQPLSPAVSANQPQTFLTPTRLLIRKVRKKWTQRSWRWGLGFLIAMLFFGLYEADDWLKRPHVLTGPNSADSLVASFLIIVLFFGTPLGWLVGTALELKSIFKEDFGEFRVCLTSEPDPGQQK
jgi:hypothetical protein